MPSANRSDQVIDEISISGFVVRRRMAIDHDLARQPHHQVRRRGQEPLRVPVDTRLVLAQPEDLWPDRLATSGDSAQREQRFRAPSAAPVTESEAPPACRCRRGSPAAAASRPRTPAATHGPMAETATPATRSPEGTFPTSSFDSADTLPHHTLSASSPPSPAAARQRCGRNGTRPPPLPSGRTTRPSCCCCDVYPSSESPHRESS